jgi:hypothetical protein
MCFLIFFNFDFFPPPSSPMIYLWYCHMNNEIISIINYDDFQHVNFIYVHKKFVSLFWFEDYFNEQSLPYPKV